MKRKRRIDLGLAVSGATLQPGERRTRREIAAFCECSPSFIWLIEQRAMKRLRHRLLFGRHRAIAHDFQQSLQS